MRSSNRRKNTQRVLNLCTIHQMLLFFFIVDSEVISGLGIREMDKLASLVAAKKPQSKVTVHKALIEQQQQQAKLQLQQEQQQKLLAQQQKLEEISGFYSKGSKQAKKQEVQQLPLTAQQVKEELRKLYQPVTLFGETESKRYERLLKVRKFHEEHPNEDMKLYDEEFVRRVKENEHYEELDAKYREHLIEPKILNDAAMRKKKQELVIGQQKVPLATMCDQIYLWLVKMLRCWSEVLEQKYPHSNCPETNKKFLLLEETQAELSSLYPVLRSRQGDPEMIESIYHIANCCLLREYNQANSRYIDLSIGSAPWPMGVAMLGITVRRNAERLAYVLDNQITRKWMQAIKRLITISQELFPSEDSAKMVGLTVLSFT